MRFKKKKLIIMINLFSDIKYNFFTYIRDEMSKAVRMISDFHSIISKLI